MKVTLEMERTNLNNLFDYILKKIKCYKAEIKRLVESGDIVVTYDQFNEGDVIEFKKSYQANMVGELITLIRLYNGLEESSYHCIEGVLVQLLHLYRTGNYKINKEMK